MATEKIRVGIIGANVRYGWGRDAHIPALSALPEFEITAVCTSRQETADETAKHFGILHAFAAVGATACARVLRDSTAWCGIGFGLLVYAGYFSNFGNAGFIWSHGCASDVHTSTCGLNQLGSSKLAVLIATM